MAKSRKYIFFFIIVAAVAAIILYFDSKQKKTVKSIDGAELFKRNCASCHKTDKDFTGPILKGALERWGGD